MENTLFVRGQEKSCRQKASTHIERVASAFNENTTDEEKIKAFLQIFDDVAKSKALNHISRIKSSFNENTTDEEKFEALFNAFERVANGTNRCRENFRGKNYQRWSSDTGTAEKLKSSEEEGVILMNLIQTEMEPLISSAEQKPLSVVNGTSVKFTECTKRREAATKGSIRTEITYCEHILREELPPKIQALLRKLEAKIACILASFFFIPDTFWS